jgi:hypothetical protein
VFLLLSLVLSGAAGAAQPGDLQALCRSVWGIRADETNLRSLPTSFPAPPAGARRCGAREASKTIYYVWNVPNDEILAYWTTALMRNGYRTNRVDGGTRDKDFLNFAGPLRGKISLSPRGGGFVVVAGPS